ncbi:MAG: DNA-processing protein DprA [Armatimonadetes bacterium]|nr:DNA-processing protein DprA [Armatimonadota bacterium]
MGLAFDPETDFELALCLTPGIGSGTISRILARNAISNVSKRQFLSLSPDALVEEYRLTERSARALARGAKGIEQDILKFKGRALGKNVRVITFQDPRYPGRIEGFCENPPAFLVAYGNMQVLHSKTFTVLASRDAGPDSLAATEKSVEEGVLDSMVLVTGSNTAAYQRAAVVPLRWGAPRVLVLDRGLFKALGDDLDQEPFPAARLWRYRFDAETDLVLSPFRPDDNFIGVNNKIRDELVVALSDEIRVAHVSKGGNVDKLSRRAEELGRAVIRL